MVTILFRQIDIWRIQGYVIEDVKKLATSPASYRKSEDEKLAVDNISSAMQHIFVLPDIYHLEIADGLKQLLFEKRRDLNYLVQSDPGSLANELGIEVYVAKLIIDAAKKTTTK